MVAKVGIPAAEIGETREGKEEVNEGLDCGILSAGGEGGTGSERGSETGQAGWERHDRPEWRALGLECRLWATFEQRRAVDPMAPAESRLLLPVSCTSLDVQGLPQRIPKRIRCLLVL